MANEHPDRPIRLLHLSDLHLRADRAWDQDPVLRALAGFVAGEVEAGLVPDLVVLTGDLAFSGKTEEYRLARDWLNDALWPVGGVLYLQGADKVDGLVGAVLDALGHEPTRAEQARTAGLLGALVRDFDPFGYPTHRPALRPHPGGHPGRLRPAAGPGHPPAGPHRRGGRPPGPGRRPASGLGPPRTLGRAARGRFWMGAQNRDEKAKNYDPEANDNEAPVHEVFLGAFSSPAFRSR